MRNLREYFGNCWSTQNFAQWKLTVAADVKGQKAQESVRRSCSPLNAWCLPWRHRCTFSTDLDIRKGHEEEGRKESGRSFFPCVQDGDGVFFECFSSECKFREAYVRRYLQFRVFHVELQTSCQTFQACAPWWSWACKLPIPLGMAHIYTHTLTSHVAVAVANIGRHSSLCVQRSWPQRTPVMCDNSSRHVWHISGDGPQNLLTLDQKWSAVQLGKYLTSGRRTSGIANLLFGVTKRTCLPTASQRPQSVALPSRNLKVISATYFWPFTGFHGMELSIPWAPTSLQVLEFVRVQQKRNESICTREWTLERLQTAVYVNLSEN